MVSVTINTPECTGCGACVDVCPRNVFELRNDPETNERKRISVVTNPDACIMCMACVATCSPDCISISKPSPEMII